MLQARPTLGICFLNQPYFVVCLEFFTKESEYYFYLNIGIFIEGKRLKKGGTFEIY